MSLVGSASNATTVTLIKSGLETAALEWHRAQLERCSVLSLVQNIIQPLLHQASKGHMLLPHRPLAPEHQRVRYIYGCFHIAIYTNIVGTVKLKNLPLTVAR